MSYDRMLKSETQLKNEIEALLAQAEATDVKEDAAFGIPGGTTTSPVSSPGARAALPRSKGPRRTSRKRPAPGS